MNCQHIIAQLAGFRKWTEMLKASPYALELSKLLFDNMHKISVIEWDMYISGEEKEKGFLFGDEFKLDIFKKIFDEVDSHQSNDWDYRLIKKEMLSKETSKMKQDKRKITVQIFELPLPDSDRLEFIVVANKKFENILEE